jgi:hypothetical protein
VRYERGWGVGSQFRGGGRMGREGHPFLGEREGGPIFLAGEKENIDIFRAF